MLAPSPTDRHYLSHIRGRQAIAILCTFFAWNCTAQEFGFQCFSLEDGLPRSTVTAIMEDEQGFLWLGTDGGGLARFDGHHFVVFDTDDGLTGNTVNCIAQGLDGELLVGTSPNGLSRIKGGRITAMSIAEHMPNAELTDVLVDSSGVIWCATHGSGIVRIDRSGPVIFGKANGVLSEHVNALIQLEDGVICAGTDAGLSFYRNGKWEGEEDPSLSTAIHCMACDRDEQYFGSDVGIVGSVLPDVLSGQRVSCLLLDDQYRLWAGTPDGLWMFPGDRSLPVSMTERNGLTDADIRSLYQDRSGAVWIGTAYGGVCKFTSDAFVHYTEKSGLKDASVTAIHRDEDSTLWISTEDGHAYHSTSTELKVSPGPWPFQKEDTLLRASTNYDDPLLQLPRTSAALASNGDLWIGTERNGVIRWDGKEATQYTTEDGLSANEITLVMLDAWENVWVGTRNGINMMELDVLQERVLDIDVFTTEDGFIGNEVMPNAGMLDHDSTLWFGTTEGATHYDPRNVFRDENEPHTRITDIYLMREDVDWSQRADSLHGITGLPIGLELPHNKDQLTFFFAGISLAAPDKVKYQFILEGHDPDWSPITEQDEVTYSKIPPGEYTFKVIARNGSGIWNQEPETFSFTITPPFWQTTWFQLGGGLLLLLGLFGIVRLRTRSLRRKQERLERMVATRTEELADSKKRSDDLLRNILPHETAEELKLHGKAATKEYEFCSVLFSDFKGFTMLSESMSSDTLVTELDRYFRSFDRVTDEFGIEKIKTIGDAYMCACGLPKSNHTHALDAVLMGLKMISIVDRLNNERAERGIPPWQIRIGIHTGPVVAGVVGEKKFAYDIWGDTVNLASRMESNGEPGRINISGATYAQVMDFIQCTPRGPLSVKGKGEVQMYFVERIRPEYSADEHGTVPNQQLQEARLNQQLVDRLN